MKKLILQLFVLIMLVGDIKAQTVHDISIKSITGDMINLKQYVGKKIMFILLPFDSNDSTYKQLASFQDLYQNLITVIGIPSVEDGYKQTDAVSLNFLYKNSGIILTEGMMTQKTSGTNQSLLMQWLTDRTKNQHFNNDAVGVGSKFFISETGILYAALPPKASLESRIVDRAVHAAPK